jgi:lysophospholipase L1-like esterase
MIGEAAPRRVLFFGDSLVAGVGDPAGGGWVARVVSASVTRGQPLTAYNLGVRRETSLQVAARWRAEAEPRVPAGTTAQIVLSFGANDTSIEDGVPRVPAGDARRALALILREAHALGFETLVVGPAPVDDAAQNHRIKALTASFAEVCDEQQAPFIGVIDALLETPAWMAEIAAGDGAHPGADGYQILAQLLIDEGLVSWLAKPPLTTPRRN